MKSLMWMKRRSWQKTIQVNWVRKSKCGMSRKTKRDQGRHKGLEPNNLDSSEQDESSFAELDVAETEELAEHDSGEQGEGLGNTEQSVGVGMLKLFTQSARESKTTWSQPMWREMMDLVLVASQH